MSLENWKNTLSSRPSKSHQGPYRVLISLKESILSKGSKGPKTLLKALKGSKRLSKGPHGLQRIVKTIKGPLRVLKWSSMVLKWSSKSFQGSWDGLLNSPQGFLGSILWKGSQDTQRVLKALKRSSWPYKSLQGSFNSSQDPQLILRTLKIFFWRATQFRLTS